MPSMYRKQIPTGIGGIDPSLTSTASRKTEFGNPTDKENLFSKLYSALASGRDNVAEFVAGKPNNRAYDLHESYMEGAAEKLSPYIGETLTKGLLTGIGNANESVAGVISGLLGGKGVFGPQGIDYGDMDANDRGIEKGLAKNRKLPGFFDRRTSIGYIPGE